MRILKVEDAKLSNWEVFHHLKSQKSSNPDQDKISHLILQYLSNETSASIESLSMNDIEQCIQKLGLFALSMEEKLQIVNLMPTSLVEVHMIVERCADRLTESETLDILNVVQEYLKPVFLHMQHGDDEDAHDEEQGEQPEEDQDEDDVGHIDLGF
mmetsp:Transcript_6183/g.23376  ORF Transcript_6183/g.23376 Transcript_6183/m.23376 type:complete len:156 (-) Transcript_6183:403-870(-)|eukprot:CAMPEP_0117445220 /NCGR_PEP_ID=MMETSP0759-20121206/5676_1 /TAXON_ID=63605 /ORGANISM="Percolomonas cosmopolitus, Strain WS" /LENGTH=155 /DNA_ID=CAMNT_0005237375 /DNA_START=53 /DNA_END=520 /DNA_ORIENTATION=+